MHIFDQKRYDKNERTGHWAAKIQKYHFPPTCNVVGRPEIGDESSLRWNTHRLQVNSKFRSYRGSLCASSSWYLCVRACQSTWNYCELLSACRDLVKYLEVTKRKWWTWPFRRVQLANSNSLVLVLHSFWSLVVTLGQKSLLRSSCVFQHSSSARQSLIVLFLDSITGDVVGHEHGVSNNDESTMTATIFQYFQTCSNFLSSYFSSLNQIALNFSRHGAHGLELPVGDVALSGQSLTTPW